MPINLNQVLALWAATAIAASAAGATLKVPEQYATVQAAVDASSHGDTILIAAGTHTTSSIYLDSQTLTFQGMTDGNGEPATTLDAQGASRCIYSGNCNLEFSNLVFTGGTSQGANVHGTYTFTNCHFRDNDGDGLTADWVGLTIENCKFTGNGGHGLYVLSGNLPSVTGCLFQNNLDSGIRLDSMNQANFIDCIVKNNSADKGGGIQFHGEGAVSLEGCIITNNSASDSGGGLYLNAYGNGPTVSITSSQINSNTAAQTGGGIYSGLIPLNMTGCTVSGNTADEGGGVDLADTSGLTNTISGTAFENNTATGINGGGLHVTAGTLINMSGCTFQGNAAQFGGGARIRGDNHVLSDCTFSDNSADIGGGILHTSTTAGSSDYMNCTFANNTAAGDGAVGGGVAIAWCSVDLHQCDFANNQAETAGGAINIGGSTGAANVGSSTFCGSSPDHISGSWSDEGGNTFDVSCGGDCPGDLDGNGEVGVDDLLALLAAFGTSDAGDVNGDGQTNVEDLLMMISAWGEC
ncbi:MAG: right-handed parallel beta-helix repeat-containing protein [Phycisphaerales bacterium]|nr:right-handed parallel beta-helix repeat-containing protein [Phycisphaerales bacterium]